jgi:hypothetical protein
VWLGCGLCVFEDVRVSSHRYNMRGIVHISSSHLMQLLELRQKVYVPNFDILSNFCMIFMNSYVDEVKVRN